MKNPVDDVLERTEVVDSWLESFYLFDEIYDDVFGSRGIGRETALLAWEINKLRNVLIESKADDSDSQAI
jgi:hypothetical protein